MTTVREALVALVRGFRFEITVHISTGATDDDDQAVGQVGFRPNP